MRCPHRGALMLVIATPIHAQVCTPDWIPTFEGGTPGGAARAFAVFDRDGAGPEEPSLFVLSYPRLPNASAHPPVQRWTGRTWEPVGGTSLRVNSSGPGNGRRGGFALFDPDGSGAQPESLYVVGPIVSTSDDPSASGIARFDGVNWVSVGSYFRSTSARLYDIEVFQGALYVAGESFPTDGAFIARWDGSTWTTISAPLGEISTCYDLQVWDQDGPGPLPAHLYAAGIFDQSLLDPPGPSYLAAWDGSMWSSVGLGLTNRPGVALGLGVYDTDHNSATPSDLYVVSNFNDVDAIVGGITRWNGTEWTRVVEADYVVTAGLPNLGRMHVHDDDGPGPIEPALYIAASGMPNSPAWLGISRWDGTTLTPLGDLEGPIPGGGPQRSLIQGISLADTSRFIDALSSFDIDGDGPLPSSLIVGGGFTSVAAPPFFIGSGQPYMTKEVSANFVATWDGVRWGALGQGLAAPLPNVAQATTVVSLDPDQSGPAPESLYVGGVFNSAGPLSIPLRTDSFISNSGEFGGAMSNANARWNAINGWSRAGLDPDFDPRSMARRIIAVTTFDSDGPSGPLQATTHIAGSFDQLDGAALGPIARWNAALAMGNGAWETIGTIAGGQSVAALQVFDADGEGGFPPVLFASGDFDSVTNTSSTANGAVVAWNGSSWTGTGFSSGAPNVSELAVFDPDGAGPSEPALIAAGNFVHPTASGDAVDIARYDRATASWSPLAPGAFFVSQTSGDSAQLSALAVYDDDGAGPMPPALYVAGNFVRWFDGVTTIPLSGIARWNGFEWSAVGDPLVGVCPSEPANVSDILVFDPDGRGPYPTSLFVGGELTIPGSLSDGIARWDGLQWHPLTEGLRFFPYRFVLPGGCTSTNGGFSRDLHVFDDDAEGPNPPALFVAGAFFTAGASPNSAWALAKWGCTGPLNLPPLGDANSDTMVNFADITNILENWGTLYPNSTGPGDADRNGIVNFADISSVLTNFAPPR